MRWRARAPSRAMIASAILARLDLLEVQVDRHRLGDRLRIGLPDEQAAVQAAAHLRQAVVLQEPNRLAEHRPAHAVARDQLHLAAEQLSRLPALAYNRLLDLVSDYLCLLHGDVSLLARASTGATPAEWFYKGRTIL